MIKFRNSELASLMQKQIEWERERQDLQNQRKKRKQNRVNGPTLWTTIDEKRAIDFMASTEPRGTNRTIPTVSDRKRRLNVYLLTAKDRLWPKSVLVHEVMKYAREKLIDLRGE